MKKLMIIALASCSLGCGTLNKDKLFSKNVLSEILRQEQHETLLTKLTLTSKDSGDAVMKLVIWPKGEFLFNPTTGFRGKALRMEWSGRQSHLSQSTELLTAKREAITNLKIQKENVVKQKEKKVEWEGMRYGIGFVLLLLALTAVCFFRKRLANETL